MSEFTKCTVRDGRFVDACSTLLECADNIIPGFSKAKGIARWSYTNLTTLQPSRTFYGVKTKENPNGMLFNFCPFCGEPIDAPFLDDEEQAEQVPA